MGEDTGLGTWIGGALGVGIPGESEAGAGMCGWSSIHLSSSKRRDIILGRSMFPTSYSTLMHQVFSSRVKWRSKSIGTISYFPAQSNLTLAFCLKREIISATSGWVSDHKVSRSTVKPSENSSVITQSTCRGELSMVRSCEYLATNGCTLPCSALSCRPVYPIDTLPQQPCGQRIGRCLSPLPGRRSSVW